MTGTGKHGACLQDRASPLADRAWGSGLRWGRHGPGLRQLPQRVRHPIRFL